MNKLIKLELDKQIGDLCFEIISGNMGPFHVKQLLISVLDYCEPEEMRIGDPAHDGIVSDGEIEYHNLAVNKMQSKREELGLGK